MHPPVARFCRELAAELGHATQCNAYVTPAGDAQGFDFHHDTHDVFVLQVSGRKRWIVHEPVLPLPLPSQPQAGAHLVTEPAPSRCSTSSSRRATASTCPAATSTPPSRPTSTRCT